MGRLLSVIAAGVAAAALVAGPAGADTGAGRYRVSYNDPYLFGNTSCMGIHMAGANEIGRAHV